MRVLWAHKINRPSAALAHSFPAELRATLSPETRNLDRSSMTHILAPTGSAHSKHCFAVCGIAEQASKKRTRGRGRSAATASYSPIKKGSHRLMMKTGIVGGPFLPSTASRSAGQIIWMLFSSHCYTKCGGGLSVGRSVGPTTSQVRSGRIPNQSSLRTRTTATVAKGFSSSLSLPCMIQQGGGY